MIEPSGGGPEWIELHNPNSFAVNLSGWALSKQSPNSPNALHLFTEGVISGGSVIILSGNPQIQPDYGAESIFDLFQSGVLGSGQNNLVDQYEGKHFFLQLNKEIRKEKMSFPEKNDNSPNQ